MQKNYKVDNAVILAAGRGRRLNKYTKVTPKPLLPNRHGIPLIEDIIEKLHEKKINEILLVTGYKSRKFNYLKDKYNVKIIKNREWRSTNNPSSINMAFDFMKNSLVINGDVVMNKNIIENYFPHSVTYVEKNKHLQEWIVELDKDQVVDFIKKGEDMEGYYQREICFITEELLEKIKNEIVKFPMNEYYEYLLIDSSLRNNIKFGIHEIPKNTITDLDSIEQYERYLGTKEKYGN